jgi:hypothetical protein
MLYDQGAHTVISLKVQYITVHEQDTGQVIVAVTILICIHKVSSLNFTDIMWDLLFLFPVLRNNDLDRP